MSCRKLILYYRKAGPSGVGLPLNYRSYSGPVVFLLLGDVSPKPPRSAFGLRSRNTFSVADCRQCPENTDIDNIKSLLVHLAGLRGPHIDRSPAKRHSARSVWRPVGALGPIRPFCGGGRRFYGAGGRFAGDLSAEDSTCVKLHKSKRDRLEIPMKDVNYARSSGRA